MRRRVKGSEKSRLRGGPGAETRSQEKPGKFGSQPLEGVKQERHHLTRCRKELRRDSSLYKNFSLDAVFFFKPRKKEGERKRGQEDLLSHTTWRSSMGQILPDQARIEDCRAWPA